MTPAPIELAALVLAERLGDQNALAHCLVNADRAGRQNDLRRRDYFDRVAAYITTCQALKIDVRRAVIRSVA